MNEMAVTELKIIVFNLKDKEYAIPVSQARSIEKVQHITRVPGTVPFIKGVINLRGVVTPIIDLRIRLGIEAGEEKESSRVIIATLDDMEAGLVVDSANDVLDIKADSIEPPPEIIGGSEDTYISGVVKIDKRLLIMLDLAKVLNEKPGVPFGNLQ